MVEAINLVSRAKINLTLEVLGRRADGYHEIASIMQALELHDTLEITAGDDLSLTCSAPELAGADNLALKAARLLREQTGIRDGAHLHLVKQIPLAAGLGGGSSDAAQALRGLNQWWGQPLSFDELVVLAGQVGSDVPFFLFEGTARIEGRGEVVVPLPPMPPLWVVLVMPPVAIPSKTAYLYSLLSPDDYSSGQATMSVAEALQQGVPPDRSLFVNVFESVALRSFAKVRHWYQCMLRFGADGARLCGSGPTLYTLADDEEAARHLGQAIASAGGQAIVTRMVSRR